LYAIKVMKKADMVQKNLGDQGKKQEGFFVCIISSVNIELSVICMETRYSLLKKLH